MIVCVCFLEVYVEKNSLSQMDKALNPCAHRPICFETYTDLDHSLPLDCDLSNNLLNVDIHGFQQRKLVASTLAGDQVTLIHWGSWCGNWRYVLRREARWLPQQQRMCFEHVQLLRGAVCLLNFSGVFFWYMAMVTLWWTNIAIENGHRNSGFWFSH